MRLITDASGAADKRTAYKPFGEFTDIIDDVTAPEETKGWIGERYDEDARLQYLNARYYDPELGLFIQPDWWEVMQPGVGTNRYAYCMNSPIGCVDPLGNAGREPGIIERFVESIFERLFSGLRRVAPEHDWSGRDAITSLPGADLIPVYGGLLAAAEADNAEDRAVEAGLGLLGAFGKMAGLLWDGVKIGKSANRADDTGSFIYHYTDEASADSILRNGFDTDYTSDGYLYFTDNGNLTSLQAPIELALPVKRSPPTTVLRVDQDLLVQDGIVPAAGPRRVLGNRKDGDFFQGGGGTELLYDSNIPPKYIQKMD